MKELKIGERVIITLEAVEQSFCDGCCFDSGNTCLKPIGGFLGCASKEIAEHFGKYFGMLITEAKYGDMVDFEIISGY